MEKVAVYLRDEALNLAIHNEQDEFARSSFNRFYYAAFLRVKSGMSDMNKKWNEMPHASMPGLLRGQITDTLKKELRQAKKIGDGDLIAVCSSAITAARELASMLDQGRMTRVVADYRPDQLVDFSKIPNFSLNTVTVKMAGSWSKSANARMRAIEKAWRQIDA